MVPFCFIPLNIAASTATGFFSLQFWDFQFCLNVFLLHCLYHNPLFVSRTVTHSVGNLVVRYFLTLSPSIHISFLSLSLPRSVFIHFILKLLLLLSDSIHWPWYISLTNKWMAALRPRYLTQQNKIPNFLLHFCLFTCLWKYSTAET